MQDLGSRHSNAKQLGALVLIDIISVIALLAIGYFWVDGRLKQLENRVDMLSLQKDEGTNGPAVTNPRNITPPVAPVTQYKSKQGATITVDAPLSNAPVASPLKVTGKAPESWFFEGQFNVSLKDASGTTVASGPAKIAENSGANDGPVSFTATLTWSKAVTGTGMLVLQKDNPSGLAKNDDSVELPIKF